MKNKDILQAWLNGETIEFLSYHSAKWVTLKPANESQTAPGFHDNIKYRIKPKTVTSTTYIQHRTSIDNSTLHLVDSYNIKPNLELVWEDNTLISAKVL
jgi:hypothetical protein